MEGVECVLGALFLFTKEQTVGIDIYLEWEGKDKQAKDDQLVGFSTTSGHVGYLREAYNGGPYATHILVKEAFESEDCRAEIPAAVMRARLTNTSTAAKNCNVGHAMAALMQKLFTGAGASKLPTDPGDVMAYLQEHIAASDNGLDVPESVTPDTSVEEAVRSRCLALYPEDGEEYAQDVMQSFRDFVELAARRERETGKPCTVYASY
ncbi:hypothetical protein [Sphingorhabdus sp.]|uniref:hypothetical protein n=1 Tax=Sphingorhabdus sp. TaxID=1902408 RepID=UPI003341D2DE